MQHNRLFRPGLLGLCLAAALALAPAAHAQTLDKVKASGTLNLGYADNFAPFSSGTGQPTGYGIELCQRIADAVKAKLSLPNLTVKYVPVKRETLAEAAAQGQIDLLCTPAADTLKRREIASFSIPVFNGGTGVVIRKDSDASLRKVLVEGESAHSGPTWRATVNRGLANHVYAVRTGSINEEWLLAQSKRLNVVATLKRVETDAEGVQMVLDRKASAYFSERTLLEEYASRNKDAGDLVVVDRSFSYEPLALALHRNDDDFRLVVDGTLSGLYRSPAFADLYLKYFGPFRAEQAKLFQMYSRP